ncbi:hypothetical protein H6F93_08040 [Leptolyngbya sp. FACHB-671]|uniref:hypothetical protein n=1 Tax=Leptolyngbya sp. FACHB-671 TaxID=2692812 RepID=UPI0016850413|nr:hypothetical protein [Leptolyngbya sp. FACHB-671]MBD2067480.1 hypothetical protein [Leptolyngbya sp. FACHB-671]
MIAPRAYLDYATLVPTDDAEKYWVRGEREYTHVIFYEDLLKKLEISGGSKEDIEMMHIAIRKANLNFLGVDESFS